MHSTLLIALAVPPVNLLLLALLGLALTLAGRRRSGLVLLGIGLGGLLALSLPAVSERLLVALETAPPPASPTASPTAPPLPPPAAIVILGADIHLGAGRADIGLGPLSLERVRAGAILARRTGLPVLVSGGIAEPGLPAIATLMADSLAADFAIPVRWQEAASATTWENAADSAALLKPAGIGAVYVVTHPWHMRRALLAFRHFGIAATPAPTPPDRVPGFETPGFEMSDIVPRATALLTSYYALHEWIGLADYALR